MLRLSRDEREVTEDEMCIKVKRDVKRMCVKVILNVTSLDALRPLDASLTISTTCTELQRSLYLWLVKAKTQRLWTSRTNTDGTQIQNPVLFFLPCVL